MAILYTWLFVHVEGAVFAAILFHTMSNFSSDLFRPVQEVREGWASSGGVNVLLVVALTVVVLVAFG
ncbi:MAG: hypothetical protein GWN18_03615, partial [Thermoplasmata archaeon]|nr:hypothetical protein [Thermoplasmata archaeon]NIS19046.1 hypothetical protein [Thermoplasmata archaeon]NIV77828.1 hypothetical protein [Thermoplasmata archaeon]NIW81673.1 hypothetical protein [Thermoplasmata archaeon]NIW87863.1 hypothetical protein [Thermoplasmata archaeon]